METRRIALSLPTGDGFGWGVCGDNLRKTFGAGNYIERADDNNGVPFVFTEPMIHAVQGVNMLPLSLSQWSLAKNVGLAFIEDSERVKTFIPNARRYFDHICAGSTWCAQVINRAGFYHISTAIQGIDTNYFVPDTKPLDADRFTIFSGGKAEWRKGTDLAMKAIGIMMNRHADVHAITAWHNPWPQVQANLGWQHGIPGAIADAEIDIGRLHGPIDKSTRHARMLGFYQSCDIGLFPNRVEGGTNMVLTEFMACAKPVIAVNAHGHTDVIDPDSDLNLVAEKRILTAGTTPIGEYWEANLDDIVETLEYAYEHRDCLPIEGERNRQAMKRFTWKACAEVLRDACRV